MLSIADDNRSEEMAKVGLNPRQIEKVFTDCAMDLKRILVLDGIDMLPDGFRVRSHDLYGPLLEIVVRNSGDTLQDKEKLGGETCKLLAIVGLRDGIEVWLPGSRFLPPTSINDWAVVGLHARPKAWIAEGKNFLEAYHELHSQIVG